MSTESLPAAALIVLHAGDNVAVARVALSPGTSIARPDGMALNVTDRIDAGHKVALRAIEAGEPVLKYGQPIGVASTAIAAGAHVHVHNLGMGAALPSSPAELRATSALGLPDAASFDG